MSLFEEYKIGENFSVLTDFTQNEYLKMSENMGVQQPSKSFIKFTEKNLKRHIKLYIGPILKEEKRRIRVQNAINTMPHGFFWKLFHSSTWSQVEFYLKNKRFEENSSLKKNEEVISTVPVVLNPQAVPLTSNLQNQEKENERNYDF